MNQWSAPVFHKAMDAATQILAIEAALSDRFDDDDDFEGEAMRRLLTNYLPAGEA